MRGQLELRLALVVAALLGIPQSADAAPTGVPASVRATILRIKAQISHKENSRQDENGEAGECGSLSIAPVASTRRAGKTETIVYAGDIINAPDCD